MRAIPFLITFLINLGIGVFLFFFLLLGMNGFSEKQAEPGLIFFIVWVLLASLITAILSVISTNYFTTQKSMNFWLAALLSTFIFVVIGAGLSVVGWFASLFITSAIR
jgi:hypothetical protein